MFNNIMVLIGKEIVSAMLVNALWSVYKEYCKECWKTFYKTGK